MTNEHVTRRQLVLLGASTLALSSQAGCKKGPPSSCNDTSSLPPAEVELRKTLEYVDRSPLAAQHCENCQQYLEPESADRCGTCKVMKGPVHPLGWCKVFAAKG